MFSHTKTMWICPLVQFYQLGANFKKLGWFIIQNILKNSQKRSSFLEFSMVKFDPCSLLPVYVRTKRICRDGPEQGRHLWPEKIRWRQCSPFSVACVNVTNIRKLFYDHLRLISVSVDNRVAALGPYSQNHCREFLATK